MPVTGLAGKTVLVTGATGFIGRRLAARLAEDPAARTVLLSRRPPRAEEPGGARWVEAGMDGLTRETWSAAGVERVDVVLHFGAFTPKSGDQADSIDGAVNDNLLGTRALLDSLPGAPERVVLASTLDVYAPPAPGEPLTEASPLGPSGLYGASKLFCEHLVRAWCAQRGCGCAILRVGHVFGPGEEAYRKLIPQTIRQLLAGERPTLWGDGSAERDFLYVDDAAEAALRAAASPLPALGPVNVVRGESVPVREIVAMLVEITGFAEGPRFLEDRPAGASLRFDAGRMRELLGEWPLVPLREGLAREVEAFRALPA